jgi:DNA repair protein RadC
LTPLQKRFLKTGLEGLSHRAIIELLLLSPDLSPVECRRLAGEVAKRYKTPRQLVTASDEELSQLGVTPRGLLHIKFVREVAKEVLKEGINQIVYTSPQDIFEYLAYSMRDLKSEVLKVLYLNSRGQIRGIEDVFRGEAESIAINFRVIAERAMGCRAQNLVFAHNHTSGDPTPSPSDEGLTRDLVFMGIILQIRVLDHIIIGENCYFSFAGEGLIKKYEESFLNLKIKGALSNTGRRFSRAYKLYALLM